MPLIALLGLQLWELSLNELSMFIVVHLHHANIALPSWFERALRVVIVTPFTHKVHHSRGQPETDSNYSSLFSFWDRLSRTMRLRDDPRTLRFGLDEFTRPEDHTLNGFLATPSTESSAGANTRRCSSQWETDAMKLRESGMPEETYWETLFDVPLILDRLGVDDSLKNVFELGCGYGTFTLPVARRISGILEAVDIEPAMIERTRQRAEAEGLRNIVCELRDVMANGFRGMDDNRDACLLFNILHCEQRVRLLKMAARAVRRGGWVLVIHWRYDPATPRGPSMQIRPRPEQVMQSAELTGALTAMGGVIDLPPWHYGLRLRHNDNRTESTTT